MPCELHEVWRGELLGDLCRSHARQTTSKQFDMSREFDAFILDGIERMRERESASAKKRRKNSPKRWPPPTAEQIPAQRRVRLSVGSRAPRAHRTRLADLYIRGALLPRTGYG